MNRGSEAGFTLVEAVVVIVITGILAGVVAVFITRPVEGYLDAARRAALADEADTALQRMTRDLRLALPNSIVVNADRTSLTYVPTSAGGRYREEKDPDPLKSSDPLDFTQADTAFDVLGPVMPAFQAGDQIVVYNLGVPGADVYAGDDRAAFSSVSGNTVTITPAMKFPFESPRRRFQVAQGAVTYACGDGALRRNGVLLASHVRSCRLDYASGVTERSGLVVMVLVLADESGESVTLINQVHVSNVP